MSEPSGDDIFQCRVGRLQSAVVADKTEEILDRTCRRTTILQCVPEDRPCPRVAFVLTHGISDHCGLLLFTHEPSRIRTVGRSTVFRHPDLLTTVSVPDHDASQ